MNFILHSRLNGYVYMSHGDGDGDDDDDLLGIKLLSFLGHFRQRIDRSIIYPPIHCFIHGAPVYPFSQREDQD